MRILLVSEDLPVAQLGGAGKHAVLLGNTLLEAGHQVEMLGRVRAAGVEGNNAFNGVLHADIDFAGTGWKEHVMGVFNPLRRAHMARRVWQAIQRRGLDWDAIHYHGHFPMLGALVPQGVNFVHTLHDQGSECITKIRFRDNRPCAERDPAACAACATPRPNALQAHVSAQAVRSLRDQARVAFTRHQAIFVSRFLETRFREVIGPAPLRAHVIHNFIDAADLRRQLDAAAPEPDASPRPRIFLAGRVDAAKGFAAFLDALPDAFLQRCEVTVAGDGPDLDNVRARHAPRGVRFSGWQPLAAVLRATARADACVVPSIWEEPFGTTTLEALALGRPVYALARGGTPELAAYEQTPGQLRLFHDMRALVADLAQVQRSAPARAVSAAADVRQRLPAILAVYEAGLAGRIERRHTT
ncbi:MAG: glycosyltransferase family 4 protein [Pseudomonadota bacterium]